MVAILVFMGASLVSVDDAWVRRPVFEDFFAVLVRQRGVRPLLKPAPPD